VETTVVADVLRDLSIESVVLVVGADVMVLTVVVDVGPTL
jgi:hypothetical protein